MNIIDFKAAKIVKQYQDQNNYVDNLALDNVKLSAKKQWDSKSYSKAYMELLTNQIN